MSVSSGCSIPMSHGDQAIQCRVSPSIELHRGPMLDPNVLDRIEVVYINIKCKY